MATKPRLFRPRGQQARDEQKRDADRRRGSACERGYTSRWDKASAGHIRNDPLCRYCALAGEVKAAELTDHLYPHKRDQAVFWNRTYWISSCFDCHNGFKQRVERRGRHAIDALAHRLGLPPMPAPSAPMGRGG